MLPAHTILKAILGLLILFDASASIAEEVLIESHNLTSFLQPVTSERFACRLGEIVQPGMLNRIPLKTGRIWRPITLKHLARYAAVRRANYLKLRRGWAPEKRYRARRRIGELQRIARRAEMLHGICITRGKSGLGVKPVTPKPTAPPISGFGKPAPPTPTPTAPPRSGGRTLYGAGINVTDLQIFPPDNVWNTDISDAPVDPRSDQLISAVGREKPLHPNFGTTWLGAPNGIPYMVVNGNEKRVEVSFEYRGESDPGPYPIPDNAPIEGGGTGGGDRHVIIVDRDNMMLYELFNAFPNGNGSWRASSGAKFDLRSNHDRNLGWTSADAAGLPIFPGLVRYDEVMERGEIKHALRFTVGRTRNSFVHPARHAASWSDGPSLPPMGMRVRLKASYDISRYPRSVQVILTAMKRYGMILADNGGDWFVGGAPDARWSDSDLHALKQVKGSDLEVVAMGSLTKQPR